MSSIVSTAFSLVSSIVGAILSPVFKALMPDVDYKQPEFEGQTSPSFSVGLKNTVSKDLPVPVVYGDEIRVAGNIIHYEKVPPIENNDVVRAVIGIGEGEITSVSDLRIGEYDWDQYAEDAPNAGWAAWYGADGQSWDSPDISTGAVSVSLAKDPRITVDNVYATIPEQI